MGFVCGECGAGEVVIQYTGNLIIHICSHCGRHAEYRRDYPAKRKEGDEPWEHRVEMTPEHVENGVYYFTTPHGRLEIDLKGIRARKCELVEQRNKQFEQWQTMADAYVRIRKILGFAGLGNDDPEIFEQAELKLLKIMSEHCAAMAFHRQTSKACKVLTDESFREAVRGALDEFQYVLKHEEADDVEDVPITT